MLDVVEYLVQQSKRHSFPHSSELSFYLVVAHVSGIDFNDTNIALIKGENCPQATKNEQIESNKQYQDGDSTKKSIGRRIDLIMCRSKTELSSNEWKKRKYYCDHD